MLDKAEPTNAPTEQQTSDQDSQESPITEDEEAPAFVIRRSFEKASFVSGVASDYVLVDC
jgi:hypothetical protein